MMVRASPKLRTKGDESRSEGMGRILVRFIRASRSDSYHMLSALAPPDESAVPMVVPRMSLSQRDQPVRS